MRSRKLYEILGLACGFVLIDFGFNFVATGFPGAREFTSQFLGANLIVGGSALIFGSLYYLLKPAVLTAPALGGAVAGAPDVGVETIVEEETPPKSSFYRNISLVGYFFTILGFFSAADLVLQVFLRSTYNEVRWWVEILLVTFGVLSYTIFGSVGHFGAQEEANLAVAAPTHPTPTVSPSPEPPPLVTTATATPSYPETLDVQIAAFKQIASGEYERHLFGEVFDAMRIEPDMVTIWREDRTGMRSVYLAGPYELNKQLLNDQLKSGQSLQIGSLNLSVDSIRELLSLQERPVATSAG